MAPHRALTFPLSDIEETARESPFKIHNGDFTKLGTCDAFRIIRKLLANQQGTGFCNSHARIESNERESWLLQRDITHALIFPILQLFRHASNVAKSMLGDRNVFDLELVYRGEARGAFAWLQCFIAEEEDWCLTKGCPACVVTKVLEAEPTIRVVLVACRLSRTLRQPQTSPKLPVLDFWLSSLRNALNEDPFWGPDFREHLERRAAALEHGLNELVTQCFEIESVASKGSLNVNLAAPVESHPNAPSKPTNLRTSRLAEKQVALVEEETTWMHQSVVGCWTTLLADAAKSGRKASVLTPQILPIRARCLTS